RAAAATRVKEDVLEDPESLLQLFCLNYDFGDSWNGFVSATDDASRLLEVDLCQDDFPYWVKRLGMDDTLAANFAVIDWAKNKLTIAPAAVTPTGDADDGWSIAIDQGSPVFPFLLKNRTAKVYMAISYLMES